MSDFESRVRGALHGVAGEAPAPHGLAEGARRRARNRGRTLLAVSAAAVAAAIAVPAVLAFGGPDASGPVTRDPSPPVASTSTSPSEGPEVKTDGRIETWRNLEIRVPYDWGYGNLSTWCMAGLDPEDPVVERPGGAVRSNRCQTPDSGYGAQFFDPAAYDPAYPPGHVRRIEANDSDAMPFPVGSWVGYQYAGNVATADAAVLVVATSEQIAREVLASAWLVKRADSNGCAPRDSAVDGADPDEVMTVCRYAADGWLQQSEQLSAADTAELLAAVEAAPETAYAPPCPAPIVLPEPVSQYVVMLVGETRMEVVWEGQPCADQGVFIDERERRKLTADVMYWALSPGWSGAVDDSVPLPGELRR